MRDYSAEIIAARKFLRAAEEAANHGHWLAMQHAAESACLRCVALEQWADAKLRERSELSRTT